MSAAVIESYQVSGDQMGGDFHFPGARMMNTSTVGSASGMGLEDFAPASISLPQQLFNTPHSGPVNVANLLIMNADQFFPSTK